MKIFIVSLISLILLFATVIIITDMTVQNLNEIENEFLKAYDYLNSEDIQNAEFHFNAGKEKWEKIQPFLLQTIRHDFFKSIESNLQKANFYEEKTEQKKFLDSLKFLCEDIAKLSETICCPF